jgi:hypothetical protein
MVERRIDLWRNFFKIHYPYGIANFTNLGNRGVV